MLSCILWSKFFGIKLELMILAIYFPYFSWNFWTTCFWKEMNCFYFKGQLIISWLPRTQHHLLKLSIKVGLRGLFPFCKQSLPFLTVDATISIQAFSHDRCSILPGLSYKKTKNTFSNAVRKNDIGAQVEFSGYNLRARVTCYWRNC